jgi:shikimate kinase
VPNPTRDHAHVQPASEERRVVLVGMMGAGKSTVGALLSTGLGTGFADSDREVERALRMKVPEIFEHRGEGEFRRAESHALEVLLGPGGPGVVAAGGGAVLEERNRELIRSRATCVWLRTGPRTLADRLGDGAGRPLLSGGVLSDRLEALARERYPLYESVADLVVDTDDPALPDARAVAARVQTELADRVARLAAQVAERTARKGGARSA